MTVPRNRKHERVRATGVAAHVRSDKYTPSCFLENISEGGIFVRTNEHLPLGLPVVVDLVKPGMKKALRLTGRVVSRRQSPATSQGHALPGVGICFDLPEGETQERLGALLKLLGLGPSPMDIGWDAPAQPLAGPTVTAAVAADPNRVASSAADTELVTEQLRLAKEEALKWQQLVGVRERELLELRAQVEKLEAERGVTAQEHVIRQLYGEMKRLKEQMLDMQGRLGQIRQIAGGS